MTGRQTTEGKSGEQTIKRRAVLKAAGATAAGAAVFPGLAAAHQGKEISWVAFCGCEEFCIRYTRCGDDGELFALAYEAPDDCTVYYKAGHDIYEHQYTRLQDPENLEDGEEPITYDVIETGYAGNGDTVASTNPSDSRDPCGILDGSDGTKIEREDLDCGNNPDCPPEDGSGDDGENGTTASDEEDDGRGAGPGNGNGRGNDDGPGNGNGRRDDDGPGNGKGRGNEKGRGNGNGPGNGNGRGND